MKASQGIIQNRPMFKVSLFKVLLALIFYVNCGFESDNSQDHSKESPEGRNSKTISLTKSDKVNIKLVWDFKNLPSNLKMELYEPPSQRPFSLWETGSGKDESKLAFSKPIIGDGKSIILNPGTKKQFVLVIRNPKEETLHFFAAPHRAEPEEASLGFKFKCLCINHAFTIPPKETWYRVVELKLSDAFLGDNLIVSHSIIGIPKERVKDFQKSASSDHEH
jgi:hypothetical protein